MTGTGASDKLIRVLVIDDDESVRALIARLIGEQADMQLVGEASNGKVGVAVAQRTRPDVVVIDGMMPVMGGVEAMRLIIAALPGTRIVGFSGIPEKMEELFVSGAVSVVEKGLPLGNLVAAVRLAGGRNPTRRP